MKALRIRTLLLTCLFSLAACTLMWYLILTGKGQVADVAGASPDTAADGYEIVRLADDAGTADLSIPLPADAHYENVSFENHYLDNCLVVRIRTRDTSYYRTHPVRCLPDKVLSAYCTAPEDGGQIALSFDLDRLYEPTPEIKEEAISITLAHPGARYDKIVIIDPVYQGAGADASLFLAERIRETAEKENDGMRIYLTRTDRSSARDDASVMLAQESGATRYLRLEVPGGESALAYHSTFYDVYYIRGYGNAAFAADLAWSLSSVEEMRTDGVSAADDDALRHMKITAATLHIDGIRSVNGTYAALLNRMADAVCHIIVEGY